MPRETSRTAIFEIKSWLDPIVILKLCNDGSKKKDRNTLPIRDVILMLVMKLLVHIIMDLHHVHVDVEEMLANIKATLARGMNRHSFAIAE